MPVLIYSGICAVYSPMLCMADDPENDMVVAVAQQKRSHGVKHTATLTSDTPILVTP